MSNPLLKTKLYIPPVRPPASLVVRPRLLRQLNRSLQHTPGVTLISAPAGFGKTTLLSEWLHHLEYTGDESQSKEIQSPKSEFVNQIAWLSLDRDDNDPPRFFNYLVAALQTVQPNLGEAALPMLQSPPPLPVEALVITLINQIAGLQNPLMLVLDDYHTIQAQSIHAAVTFLLEHLPPLMHVVIAGRTDPPLPLARLRGKGILTELRADDLRFTRDEAGQFFNNTTGLSLTPQEVDALDERIEGWVVGFQLAALFLQGFTTADRHNLVWAITGSDRYIADYLIEEVLLRQPPNIQNFLLQSSILDRLCGPLCDEVVLGVEVPGSDRLTGTRPDSSSAGRSQQILEYLERANLFVIPLDHQRRWYRYYHLFADLLQNRLRQTQPHLLLALHRRAGRWYRQNGWPKKAVTHALSGEDYHTAAQWIAQDAPDMLKRGEFASLRRWLEQLPPEIIRTWPELGVALAWTLLFTGPIHVLEELNQALADAEQAIQSLGGDAAASRHELQLEIQTIRAIVAIEQGDTSPGTVQLARQALEQLGQENRFLYSALTASLALAYRTNGETSAAVQMLTRAKTTAQKSDNIFSVLFVNHELAQLQIEHGQLRQAMALHRQSLALVDRRFGAGARYLPWAGAGHIGLGELFYQQDNLDMAREHLETGIEISGQPGNMGLARQGMVAMAFLQQALGNNRRATEWMAQAEALAREAPRSQVSRHIEICRVRLWLMQGQISRLRQWVAKQENRLDVTAVPAYADELAYLVLVGGYLAVENRERLTVIVPVLAQLLEKAETQQRTGRTVEILPLLALVEYALGHVEAALNALERGFLLAEPEGYVRLFVDYGQPIVNLLQLASARKINPGYTARLLAAGKAHQGRQVSEPQPLVESLTEREIEVLNLIAGGLSNKEIAETLFIAVGTVKRHSMNIYGKLDVNSRTRAVLTARELGLIE